MEQHDREELAEVNAARKGFYEFLASMYKLELTDEQIGTLTKQDLPTDAEYVGAGYATVKEYLRHRDSGTSLPWTTRACSCARACTSS